MRPTVLWIFVEEENIGLCTITLNEWKKLFMFSYSDVHHTTNYSYTYFVTLAALITFPLNGPIKVPNEIALDSIWEKKLHFGRETTVLF